MSEMKCPCCGGELLINDGYDESQDFPFCDCQKCFFACNIDDIPRIAAAMKAEARHNALVEAVAWERDCCQDIRPLFAWAGLYVRHGEDYVDDVAEELRAIQDAARAEVERMIANETADDCKEDE